MVKRGWIVAVCCALLLVVSGCFLVQTPTPSLTPTAMTFFNGSRPDFGDVVESVMCSVVYIYVEGEFGAVSGSGVILDPDGYILTNRHVVDGADVVEVTLQDMTPYEATDVWTTSVADLAVVKIDAHDLPPARLGDPSTLRLGEWVLALGHPLGMSPSKGGAAVTVGIISNLERSLTLYGAYHYNTIQTDAAINLGNSGGPLINANGDVVGINTAVYGQAQNIAYAINVSMAALVYNDLVRYGKVVRPTIGADMDDVTPATARAECPAQRTGARIVRLMPDGPADRAGILVHDVIIAMEGVGITSAAQFVRELWQHGVGEEVEIVSWRGDSEMRTTVTLTETAR